MTARVWPADLPQFALTEGFSEGLPDGRLFSARETGPPATRNRFSAAAAPLSMQTICTPNQMAVFDIFYRDTLGNGALWFYAPDWRYNETPLGTEALEPITTEDDEIILISAIGRFLFAQQAPAWTPDIGVHWRLSAQLLRLPKV